MTISRRFSPQVVRKSADCLSAGSTHSQESCGWNSKPVHEKSVKFANADDSATSSSSYELCDNTKKELWWSSEELKDNSEQRKDLVKQFKADQQEGDENNTVDKKVVALYQSCARMNVPQVLRSKANKQLLSDISSDVRGLEVKLSRAVQSQRRRHVQSVLSIVGQGNTGDDLAVMSAQSSRTSQVLARVLAQIDAQECM